MAAMPLILIAVAAATGIVTAGALAIAIPILDRRSIVDVPGERTNHHRRTPRGGGFAVTPAILLAWIAMLLAGWPAGAFAAQGAAIVATFVLFVVSVLDDVRSLPARARIAAHLGAVVLVLAMAPAEWRLLPGYLPIGPERMLIGLCWVWFTNLTNFMDGIDGITGVEMIAIGAGIAALSIVHGGIPDASIGLALIVTAAYAAFLVFNWSPARIFLGDSGSIPVGFLAFGLLLDVAASGYLAAALILPAYYVVDASTTIGLRIARGERFWEAHSRHAYQIAVRRGLRHSRVSGAIAICNVLLVGLALLSPGQPVAAVLAAYGVAALFYSALKRGIADGLLS